ncbi:hypothetical protein [Flavitalea sp.]|nr:hypothetical protein [Flavitalea sp.]
MNKIIWLACLLLIHSTCISQSTSSLVGKWKLFCLSDDEIYFNLKTDSFSVSDEIKLTYPEPEKQKQLVNIQIVMWQNMQYHFGNDGKYKAFLNDSFPLDEGKYREDKKGGILECDAIGDDGIIRTEKISYRIKDQYLHLKMAWTDRPVVFILERMK